MASIINGIYNAVVSWWNKPAAQVPPVPSLQDSAIAAVAKKYENIGSPNGPAASIKDWKIITWFVNRKESEGRVRKTIQSIETKVMAQKPAEIDPDLYLQSRVTDMFRELKAAFPVPLTDLAQLQDWEDDALQKIYAKLVEKYQFPSLNTVDEMKAFLNDPANQPLILSVDRIFLPYAGIKAIPPEVLKFSNLWDITLYSNQISFIPEWLGKLKNLCRLDLCDNQIAVIPESFGGLQNLFYLRLDFNKITVIPDCMGKLKKLQELHLTYNSIRVIPDTLKNLDQLRDILLSNNQIEEIPDWMGTQPKLTGIYLSHNKIRHIPNSFNRRDLLTVELRYNSIAFVPNWANNFTFKCDGFPQIQLNQIAYIAYLERPLG
jgi:hypothetical protein